MKHPHYQDWHYATGQENELELATEQIGHVRLEFGLVNEHSHTVPAQVPVLEAQTTESDPENATHLVFAVVIEREDEAGGLWS